MNRQDSLKNQQNDEDCNSQTVVLLHTKPPLVDSVPQTIFLFNLIQPNETVSLMYCLAKALKYQGAQEFDEAEARSIEGYKVCMHMVDGVVHRPTSCYRLECGRCSGQWLQIRL